MPRTVNVARPAGAGHTDLPGQKLATIRRLLKTLYGFYPRRSLLIIFCILFSAAVMALPSVFIQKVLALVELHWQSGDWQQVAGQIGHYTVILAVLYSLSLTASFAYNRMGAVVTQGCLYQLRKRMFDRMEALPLRYFDTHSHGDVMSYYTNDIDTLRQLVSQSFPQLVVSTVTVLVIFSIMLYYSFLLTLVILLSIAIMYLVLRYLGGGSARYFLQQQKALGQTEGFVEESMTGQKVIKVFCHEAETGAAFDQLNGALFVASEKANKYANVLGPVLNNIGNVFYVVVALTGSFLLVLRVPNVSFSGLALDLSIVVPFLNMTKQFIGNINQVSHHINTMVMGLAGAQRIFELLDEVPEIDEGTVTLVNARTEQGSLCECKQGQHCWAWKQVDGQGRLKALLPLKGDVRLEHVEFGYEPDKPVLHDITLFAKPGQKVAFVGATGAGKTTITNLLNRFYDITEGRIFYDGIDIKQIKKGDLRRSLGMVLQDTNLFTGTIRENIRFGRLEATDEECEEAARLAGAHDFITRLPAGYATQITGNGANLSQGQRQLLSIARAAVADPPVMILDEATSSIDTRTEALVQRGMDALMRGRTVFVIAHRLSTVREADVIMVLAHGRIIERGSHEELLAKKGQYYQLYTGAFELE